MESRIPEDVRSLILAHVDSVEKLEVLLLVREQPSRAFTADEVAAELRIDPRSAAQRLEDLQSEGLLVGNPRFRYAPRSPTLESQVAKLAELYETHRVAIISLIFSRPTERIRSFANAFRIRRGEDDG